jgi:branched-chain amino acid transport system permease protein
VTLPARCLRAVLAALAAAAVSWPLAGFTATAERGPVLSLLPALRIGGIVLAVGIGYAFLLEILRVGRVAEAGAAVRGALRARSAVGGALAGALVLLLAAVPLFASRSWTSNLVEALVFATIAVGLNISMGMAGLLVLGHAAFWAVGAYTSVLLVLHAGWNFWPAFLAGGAAAAGVGFVVGLPAIRLRGDYLALVTLGFGEAVRWVLKNETRWTGGDAGVPGSEVPGSLLEARPLPGGWTPWQPRTLEECFWFALGLLVLCVACVTLLTRSRFGRALFALREDETAARCMGIDTVRVKLLAFTASAFWAGLAGAVHPVFRGQITPEMFDFNASVLFVAMVVLGGLGSIPGSVAGAAVLFLLPQLLRDKLPGIQEYRMLLFGAVLAGLMVVRPEGLLGRPRDAEEVEEEGEGAGKEAAP